MKRIIYGFFILKVFLSGAFAQPDIDIVRKHGEYIDSLLNTVNIPRQDIETGILYNRAIPIAALQRFKQTDTISRGYFLQAALELRNAAYDTRQQRETKDLRRIANKYTYRDNLTPIGILFSEFTHIDTLAKEKGFIEFNGNGKPQFTRQLKEDGLVNKKVFLATSLCRKRELNSHVRFILLEELMTGNRIDEIMHIQVDFGDGIGFRNIKPGEIIEINYAKQGEKTISVIAITNDGNSFKSTSIVNVREDDDLIWGEYGQIPPEHQKIEIEADISYASPDGYNFPGKGELTYLIHDIENGLQKPVLIVNGFDPEDDIDDEELFFKYLNNDTLDGKYKFADELHADGYDIVILNFQPWYSNDMDEMIWVDFLQRNAFVVVEAINVLNDSLADNNSNEELVIVGASMGGLTSRYALSYMEQNEMNHNTRMWISLDSPQEGANIPIGLQYFIAIFSLISEDIEQKFEKYLKNPAAKQMLLDYWSTGDYPEPHEYRDYWFNDLESMEFPAQPRNITISNGSLNGTTLHQTTGEKALELEIKCSWNFFHLGMGKIWTTESYGEEIRVTFIEVSALILPIFFEGYAIGLEDSYSLDGSPGGYRKTFKQITESPMGDYTLNWDLYIEDHSFIPTKSSLAYSGSNPDLSEDLSGRNLVGTGETPFDNYWGLTGGNMEHATLFDSYLMFWLLREINCEPYYIVRPINFDRYITACNVHVLNNVSVKSGVKLTISAENVVIHGAFETEDDARLVIKNP